MSDLGEWELYRFTGGVSDDVVCKVALRVDEDADEVEYGIWRAEDAEPSANGRLERDGGSGWNDGAREAALRQVTEIYEDGVPEVKRGLEFQIGGLEDD